MANRVRLVVALSVLLSTLTMGVGPGTAGATPALVTVAGVVVDQNDNGISGATVTAHQYGDDGPTLVATTTSGADGSYSFSLTGHEYYRLTASHPTRVPIVADASEYLELGDTTVVGIELVLLPGNVRGTVVSPTGVAVVGAHVGIFDPTSYLGYSSEGVSRAGGTFVLHAPAGSYQLVASPPDDSPVPYADSAPTMVTITGVGANLSVVTGRTLQLRRPSLSGVVRSASDASAVANATVFVQGEGENEGFVEYTSTDSLGRYAVRVDAPGTYRVTAVPVGDDPFLGVATTKYFEVVNPDVEIDDADIDLDIPSVYGTVYLPNGATPVGFASVAFFPTDVQESPIEAFTSASGTFAAAVPDGDYEVRIRSSAVDNYDAVPTTFDWTLDDSVERPVTFLMASPTVRGVVVDSDGDPVGGGDVVIVDSQWGDLYYGMTGGADADGSFGFLAEPGDALRLVATPPSPDPRRFGSVGLDVTVPDEGIEDLEIELPVVGRPPYDVSQLEPDPASCLEIDSEAMDETLHALSADGTRLLATVCDPTSTTAFLRVIDLTTDGVVADLDPALVGDPSVTMSADGSVVAWVETDPTDFYATTYDVVVKNLDLGTERRIAIPSPTNSVDDLPIELSVDGSVLAYTRRDPDTYNTEVAVCDLSLETCDDAAWTQVGPSGIEGLALSGSGSTVAFLREQRTDFGFDYLAWEMVVADVVDGELQEKLAEPAAGPQAVPSIALSRDGTTAAWIADDRSIVEVRTRTDDTEDWTVQPALEPIAGDRLLSGQLGTRLTELELSGDGTSLFVTARVNDLAAWGLDPFFGYRTTVTYPVFQLWRVPLDTGEAELVSRMPDGNPVPGIFSSGGVEEHRVSDDGSVIAFIAQVESSDRPFYGIRRLFVGNIHLTNPYEFPEGSRITARAGSTEAFLRWPAVRAQGATYRVEVTPGDESFDTTSTNVRVDGLIPSTSYAVTVSSLDASDTIVSTLDTTFTTATTRSRDLTAVVSPGGNVALSWEAEAASDSYEVIGTSIGDEDPTYDQIGPIDTTDTSVDLTDLPAGSTWTFTVNGVADGVSNAVTDPEVVEIPELSLQSTSWSVPAVLGLAQLDTDLTITVRGEAGRSARAKILRTPSGATQPVATEVPLTETATPGTYRGVYPVNGTAYVSSVTGVIEDGHGGYVDGLATRPPIAVEAVVDLELSGPVRAGWLASIGAAGAVVAQRTIPVDGAQTLALRGVRELAAATVSVTDTTGRRILVLTEDSGAPIDVTPGERLALSATVDSFLDLEILLVDESDQPITGTYVTVSGDGEFRGATTDREGVAIVTDLREGADFQVQTGGLSPDDWILAPYDVTMTGADPVQITVKVERRPSMTLTGTVTNEDGSPVAYATVTLQQTVNGHVRNLRSSTNGIGEYSIDRVVPDMAARLSLSTWGRPGLTLEAIPVEGVPIDIEVPLPDFYRVPVLLFPYGSDTPLGLDWRTAVHFGFYANVANRYLSTSSLLEQSPGVPGGTLGVEGSPGEVVSVCFDGREARQGSACGQVTLPADGEDVADLEVRLPRIVNISADLCVAGAGTVPGNPCPSGTLPLTDWAMAQLTTGGRAVEDGWVNGALSFRTPGNGTYQLEIVSTGNPPVRATVAVEVDESSPDVIELGPIVLESPNRFSGAGNRITPDRVPVPMGGVVEFRAEWRNSGTSLQNAVAQLTIPPNTDLVAGSVVVGSRAVADASITVSGTEGSARTASVPLATIAAGGSGFLRYRLHLASGFTGSTVAGRVSVGTVGQLEPLPSTAVRVVGLTLSAPGSVSERSFTARGRAPSGDAVEIMSNGAVIGRATATSAGTWAATVTLPDGPNGRTYALSARLPGTSPVRTSDAVQVRYDASAVTATAICMRQQDPARIDGRRYCFDPRRGVAGFPFVFVPGQTLQVEVFTSAPDRVNSVKVWIGEETATAASRNVAPPTVGTVTSTDPIPAFVADFATYSARGDVSIEIDANPVRLRPEDVPARPTTRADLNPYLMPQFVDATPTTPAVATWTANEFVVSTAIDLPSAPSSPDLSVEAGMSGLVNGPTPTQIADMARDGSIVYDLQISDNPGGGSTVRFKVAADDLPTGAGLPSPVAPSLARSAGGISASNAPVTAAIDFTFKFVTNGEAGLQAWNGNEKYDAITELLGSLSECMPSSKKNELIERGTRIVKDAMAFDVANSAIALGTAGLTAAIPVALPGSLAIWAVTYGMGKASDLQIHKRTIQLEASIKVWNDFYNDPMQCQDPGKRADTGRDPDGVAPKKRRNRVASPVWIYDPSGYTFEGLPSNRISGVTATLLTAPPRGDGTCVDGLPWTVVDMEPYGQVNPLTTDEDGRYAWDVPEGCWKVQFTKDGYQTAYSAALKVLPPQLDVNVALVATAPPALETVDSTDGVVDIDFTRPMELISADAITLVPEGGDPVDATVEAVGAEQDATGRQLAASFQLTPAEALTPGVEYELVVGTSAVDYAQRPISTEFREVIDNVPAAPAIVSTSAGVGSVAVTWSAPATGGSAITGYRVSAVGTERSCTTDGALTCTISGLTAGTSYTFVATATNTVGTSPNSTPSGSVRVPSVSAVPTIVSATSSNGSAVVVWTAPTDTGGSPLLRHEARAWSAASGGSIVESCTASTGSTCTVENLTNGTAYYVDVVAVNAVGPSSASSPRRAVTPLGTLSPAPTPTITGTAKVGSTLTMASGTWGPSPVTLARQWLRNGSPIATATAATYVLSPADQGARISVRVTATKAGFVTLTTTSTETAAVAAGTLAPAPAPTISGTAKVGSKLTAKPGTWGPAPVTLAYQWLRNGVAIPRATKTTYKLVKADGGKKISVRVTATKVGYTTLAKTSAPTAAVKK